MACVLGLLGLPVLGQAAEQQGKVAPLMPAQITKQVTDLTATAHHIVIGADRRARIPSPVQALEALAGPEDVTVVSTHKKQPGSFRIAAVSIGRASGTRTSISPGAVIATDQVARVTHPELLEELTTSADGIRQDFVIPAAPRGNGDLVLELRVKDAALQQSGDAVDFLLPSGRQLHYHRLLVTDSTGKAWPARFDVGDGGNLKIVVAASSAAYPVRIDPTITSPQWNSIAQPDTDNIVRALAWDGTYLYAGGDFTAIGGVFANHVARWDGSSWSPLGSGTNNTVNTLLSQGTALYAGGSFTAAGGTTVNYLAKWDGSAWSPVGSGGMDNLVYALAGDGTNIYAGGSFLRAGGTVAYNIAKWNGGSWSSLGIGTNYNVQALAWDGTALYAGGNFTTAGGSAAARIAKWNGSAWSALGSGMNSTVTALVWDGSGLYAGGFFTTAGGTTANGIARWNGSSWSPLSSGMANVYALAWDGTALYAGGIFTSAGGATAYDIAKWNGSAWSPVAGGMNDQVYALAWNGSALYAGGKFNTAGGVVANRIAKFDGSAWSPFGKGTDGPITAFASDGSNMYVGGGFRLAGGKVANYVALWDGMAWYPLAGGLNGAVDALAWDGTALYAGGAFTTAGGAATNNIAKWDGTAWSPLGSGVNGNVYALLWDGTALCAGGSFSTAGGAAAGNVARWNGSTWSPLGSGMNSYVNSLVWDGTALYAGGAFTTAGGAAANRVARWDGSTWSPLGSGTNNSVLTLASDGTNLYAGGYFTSAGGTAAKYIGKWDGSNWSPVGSAITSYVFALIWDGIRLHAAGSNSTSGSMSGDNIAAWDGSSWTALGVGTNDSVAALGWDGTNLYAGGSFTAAGGNASRVAFAALRHRVTATAGVNGTVSPGSTTVYDGASTTVTVTPNMGFSIADVTGCGGTLTGATYTTAPITADCAISASFATTKHTLSVAVIGLGTVHTSPADMACTGNCGQSYEEGTVVTLTPSAAAGFVFSSWSGCDSVSGIQCTVTLTAAKNVTVTFSPTYNLNLMVTGQGTVHTAPGTDLACSGSCRSSYDGGTAVTLSTVPYTGYYLASWGGDCGGQQVCAVTMDRLHTVSASFAVSLAAVGSSRYGTIADAFATLSDGDILMSRALPTAEALRFDHPISFRLKGGYDAGFLDSAGSTTINGSIAIANGTVCIENIVIR